MGLSAIIATTISPLIAQVRVLQARLARTTSRERLLLGGLVLGALIYGPIAAMDWRAQQEDRYTTAQADRSTASLALSASRRISAEAPDEAAIEDMQTWGFEASNIAIAQVQIEQRLVEAATDAGLANVRITTDAEIEAIGPTQWLGGEVQADLRWTPTFDFLESLAQWPEGFRVTQFRYEITTPADFVSTEPGFVPAGRIQIGLSFPVKVANGEPTT
ncbi:hypothetical protein [Brevundimonas sp. DC300-4]|uniref:hypothetical protein n=1 Tax=Brevundimonas sp. DC300-4 TaxID=2804594 RepID=UPI003CF45306